MNYVNILARNCNTVIKNEGSNLYGEVHGRDCNTVLDQTNGGFSHLVNTSAIDCSGPGYKFRDSAFIFENVVARNNEYGIDIGPNVAGKIMGGDIRQNWEADVRYTHDVCVHIFNTAAQQLLNRTAGNGIEQVDSEWLARRILWTTSIAKKAQLVEAVGKKLMIRGLLTPIVGEAYSIAKRLLL